MGLFKKALKVYAPISGKVVDITEISDPVFAQKMVGDGIAIMPTKGDVVAPIDGEITNFFETGHAFSISNGETELLIHVGMDTVELKGEGFTKLKNTGDRVKKGEPVLKVDLDKIITLGKLTDSPVVVMDSDTKDIKKLIGDNVGAGETVILEIKNK